MKGSKLPILFASEFSLCRDIVLKVLPVDLHPFAKQAWQFAVYPGFFKGQNRLEEPNVAFYLAEIAAKIDKRRNKPSYLCAVELANDSSLQKMIRREAAIEINRRLNVGAVAGDVSEAIRLLRKANEPSPDTRQIIPGSDEYWATLRKFKYSKVPSEKFGKK